ncbi:nucleoside phosphorylase domain-containing protein [Aspergillus keveii]|uniref:Nucleoside phosphorylase domain-containing protein n=1 Tax=Aspergillus keveii TaxID=714993 RepID=A0ABR4GP94_9EURO
MWSRYSKSLSSLSQRKPENDQKRCRDLLQTQRQSLGFRQLEKIKIDCSFLPTSTWGLLGDCPASPAWLLYLQFQFSQPPDCKIATANIELLFEKTTSSSNELVREQKLGPILTEYFGPQRAHGSLVNHHADRPNAHHSPFVLKSSTEAGVAYSQDANSQWSLHGYTWPVERDGSGLHRRAEWVVTEGSHPHTAVLHRDQLRVGLVLLHDSDPFTISVRIDGQLQGAQRWLKFSRSPDPARNASIRVLPSAHQAPLDAVAESLNKDMTELLLHGDRSSPYALKGSGLETYQKIVSPQISRDKLETYPTTQSALQTASKTCDDYMVGWICALPLEMAAAKGMLDEIHPYLPMSPGDHNNYLLGRIGAHNIAVACLPAGVYGTTSAATVATQMLATFPFIRISLMVGIGAGVPSSEVDIRLGDVVVSKPTGTLGGVVQYDLARTLAGGSFSRVGSLNKPPQVLLTTLARLEAEHMVSGHQLAQLMSDMVARHPAMERFTRRRQDYLFKADYLHETSNHSCKSCDSSQCVPRPPRDMDIPTIHYGCIASGNQVMRCGETRDRLARELGIICFEMEAAGLMDTFPCLVIRGICDYADSHKNKEW